MTILVTVGIILGLILGFSLGGLLVDSKLTAKNKAVKNTAFVLLGSVFSIFVMAAEIFMVWPTHM